MATETTTANFASKINYTQLNKQWQANVVKARKKVTDSYGFRMVENREIFASAQLAAKHAGFDVEHDRSNEYLSNVVFTQELISGVIEDGKGHFLVEEGDLEISITLGLNGVLERDKAYSRGKLGEVLDYDPEVWHIDCTIKNDGTFDISIN